MALTAEQLETIKTKIETDKVRPMKAIMELFPSENYREIRKQLFETYNRKELLGYSAPPPALEPTKEEKISRLEEQLKIMNRRKARLEQQKIDLQG